MRQNEETGVVHDAWQTLNHATSARIALGRCGASLPTGEVLRFALAHAQARDAVHAPLDIERVSAEIGALGYGTITAHSRVRDRQEYLQRPDLGRRLSEESARRLATHAAGQGCDLAFLIADGLSSYAIAQGALPFMREMKTLLAPLGWRLGDVTIASHGRVALGDEVGAALGAGMVAVLIGERPGLSSPDSMGIYLTYAPRPGCLDSARNCISNVRRQGLDYPQAARKLLWLMQRARALKLTGVALKDESDAALLIPAAAPAGITAR
jgi:ethanolamine ammonia-lyase small subunit